MLNGLDLFSGGGGWPKDCIDGSGRLPTVKSSEALSGCSCRAWHGEDSQPPQYGMTCGRCEGLICPPWMSSPAGSPARTSALLELERAWTASEADLYLTPSGSLASASPDSSSWKTSQLSLFGGLIEYSWDSMRWGMMRDGQLYQPQKWEPRISESASGFLPTPTATDYGSNNHGVKEGKAQSKGSLGQMARRGAWPTPRASDGEKGSPNQQLHGSPSLTSMAVRWATPRAHETGCYQRDRGEKGKERLTLTGQAKSWPTPQARDWKDGFTPEKHGRNSPSVAVAESGHQGYLNPAFVEILMGWPIGSTVCESWVMASSLFAQKKRSRASEGS